MAPQGFKRAGEALFANIVEMVRRAGCPWSGSASSSVLTKRAKSSPGRSSFPVVAMVTGPQAGIAWGEMTVWSRASCSDTVSLAILSRER